MNKKFQTGLLSVVVMSLVACGGGGGGGGGKKSSAPASSLAASSLAASSVAAVSSAQASSEAPSSAASSVSSSVAMTSASSSLVNNSSTSSSSSSVAVATTTYTVSINPPSLNAPVTKQGRKATAQKPAPEIARDQLAVVIVDVAGNVQQTIPLDETNSRQNDDGSWTLNIPGYPRLDCVVIANLDGPITLVNGSSLFDLYPDALLSPTTGENLEVGLATTAAYQNLLDGLGGEGTFASLDVDVNDPAQLAAITNLIATIAEVLDDQLYTGSSTIAAALAQVQQQVADIVQVEVTNIKSQVDPATNTLAQALQAGGIYWVEGYSSTEIYYGGFAGLDAIEDELHYDGADFLSSPRLGGDGEVVLTSLGWQLSSDQFKASAVNQDGSVTLSNTGVANDALNAKASQVINLSGRNIAAFFGAYGDTSAIAKNINPASTFGEGTFAYRASLTNTNAAYSLWYNQGYTNTSDLKDAICPWDRDGDNIADDLASDFGGNCEVLNGLSWVQGQAWTKYVYSMTSMTELISPDVTPGTPGAKLLNINWPNGNVIAVQLLDDANKTARYFLHVWSGGTTADSQTLIGTGTWAQENLPGLTEDAAAITVKVPASVIAQGDFDSEQGTFVFTKQNGFIRIGNKTTAGEQVETGVLLINSTAKDNLLAAFNYEPALTGAWNMGGDYVIFRKDGTFAQVKTSNEDPNCKLGFASGSYQWNPETHAFSVDVENDTTAVNPNDSCSVVGIETLLIEGNTMTLTEGEEDFALTKVIPSESAPSAGAWINGGDLFVFTQDNAFIHAKVENNDPNCHVGWATGTLAWNTEARSLNATVAQDYTDDSANSTCTLAGEFEAGISGNGLYLTSGYDLVIMKRIGNPLN